MRTITTHYATIPGTDIEMELPIGPTYGEDIELFASPSEGGGWHLGYLVVDDSGSTEDPINEDAEDDEYTSVYKDFRRRYMPGTGQDGRDDYLQELQDNGVAPDHVFLVDVYEHGASQHSLASTGTQCPWDTCQGSGVLVLGSAVTGYKYNGKAYTLRDIAAGLLDAYTNWANGEVYGVISFDVDKNGVMVDGTEESCWGFIGHDHAMSGLADYSQVVMVATS